VFERAAVQTEHLEWLAPAGRRDEQEMEVIAASAREVFERLRATAWLERLEQLDRADAGDRATPVG
jgi:hypothetical protein